MGVNIINAGSNPGAQGTVGSQFSLVINPDGTINIGSLSQTINIGSILNPIQIGSIVINDFLTVIQSGTNWGVSGTQFSNMLGSVGITTNPLPISGTSLLVSGAGTFTIAGSVGITATPLPISGTNLLVTQSGGNWGVSGTAFTNVWTGIGSVLVSNVITGSVNIASNPPPWTGVGSITSVLTAGSVRIMGVSGGTSMPLLVTSGTEAILLTNISTWPGSVAITTTPIPVSGAMTNLAGSFAITTSPIPISGGTFIFNRTSVLSDVYTASSGVTTNLSGNAIPNGYTLVIKAFSTNTDYIGVGSKTTLFAQSGIRLYPNDSIKIGLDNTNRISFVPRVNSEGIEVFTET